MYVYSEAQPSIDGRGDPSLEFVALISSQGEIEVIHGSPLKRTDQQEVPAPAPYIQERLEQVITNPGAQ